MRDVFYYWAMFHVRFYGKFHWSPRLQEQEIERTAARMRMQQHGVIMLPMIIVERMKNADK
jgi:hypothetical protein